jgi:hypothetical protein
MELVAPGRAVPTETCLEAFRRRWAPQAAAVEDASGDHAYKDDGDVNVLGEEGGAMVLQEAEDNVLVTIPVGSPDVLDGPTLGKRKRPKT